MKSRTVVLILVIALSLAGNAIVEAASNTWNNGSGSGLWNDPNNWDLGFVPVYGETNGGDVQFITSLPGPVVQTPGMGADTLRMKGNAALTIDGGSLTVGSGSLLGNAQKRTATVTVNSGTIEFVDSAALPRWGTGILNMNGGNFIAADLKLGTNTYGKKGYINLDGGVITVTNNFVLDHNMCRVNVTEGTLIINGDVVSKIQGYIDNGWITSYDGKGKLYLDYDVTNPGKTTLTGRNFLHPNPADGLTVTASVDRIQWTLPEPNSLDGIVTCDVYFGTDPNHLNNPQIVFGAPVDSAPVVLDPQMEYYWSVDLYDSSGETPGEPFYRSPVFTFNTLNTAPTVEAGVYDDTWLADGPRVVQLSGSASDEDGMIEPVSLLWTVTPESDVQISDPLAPDPAITIAKAGAYTLQLEAFDGEYAVTDTAQIVVYADSCEHAKNQPGFVRLTYDRYYDCIVDFRDLAGLADEWLQDNYSKE
ncbi:MAG: hypothetical protein J7M40_07005 [Planctomycetes bacterium]|nr:hypothetical protein [Planctomycetota bacterium]